MDVLPESTTAAVKLRWIGLAVEAIVELGNSPPIEIPATEVHRPLPHQALSFRE